MFCSDKVGADLVEGFVDCTNAPDGFGHEGGTQQNSGGEANIERERCRFGELYIVVYKEALVNVVQEVGGRRHGVIDNGDKECQSRDSAEDPAADAQAAHSQAVAGAPTWLGAACLTPAASRVRAAEGYCGHENGDHPPQAGCREVVLRQNVPQPYPKEKKASRQPVTRRWWAWGRA